MFSRALLVCASVALLLSTVQADNVIDLTPENFDKVVDGSKNILVEFYAPWCGHCKRLAPEYEVVATKFNTDTSETLIARVDADEHRSLGFRFSIRGYPTLKWFPKGAHNAPIEYDGGRTAESLEHWVVNKVGSGAPAGGAAAGGQAAAPASTGPAVVDLTTANFDEHVKFSNKYALVEFYAPWCGHCKHLAPEYEKLGEAFRGHPQVLITKINADEHRDVGGRYGIRGFPTIKLFHPGGVNPVEYQGARTADAIAQFITEKSGARAGEKGSSNDPLIKLTPENWNEHIKADKHALIEFYAPWCGHCQRLMPEYQKLAQSFNGKDDVVIAQIDCDAHSGTAPCETITTYPTIKYFPSGKHNAPLLYQGNREAPAMKEYLDAHISGKEAKWAGIGIMTLSSDPEEDASLAEFVARFSKGADVALVHYYNPADETSVQFRETFKEVYWRLAGKVRFAEVDASTETAWASEFGIDRFPYVQLWYKQEPIEFVRAPTLSDLISFALSFASGKEVHYLDTITDTSNLIHAEPLSALGFFTDDKSPEARAFAAAGAQYHFELEVGLVTDTDLAKAFGVTETPTVLLFVDDQVVVYNGQWEAAAIAKWIGRETWSPVNELSKNAYARQQAFGNVPVLAFLDMEDKETNENLLTSLTTLHGKFENRFGFMWGNATKWKGFYKHLGVTGDHFPAIVISDLVKSSIYPYTSTDFSYDALESWLSDFVDGKLAKWVKSEPRPENNDGPLTIVTADTFDEIVLEQDDKDVLVEFYLPWCPHCRKLAPHYEALADSYANVDSVVIANFNIDANDVKQEYEVTGGPTLIFFPAGNKAGWKKVSGGMDEVSLSKYIVKHGGSKFEEPEIQVVPDEDEKKAEDDATSNTAAGNGTEPEQAAETAESSEESGDDESGEEKPSTVEELRRLIDEAIRKEESRPQDD